MKTNKIQPERNKLGASSTALGDLPSEILDQIATYLPLSAVSNLTQTSRSFSEYVVASGWKTFAKTNFPTWCPTTSPSFADTVRTLTSVSRAWSEKAILASFIEPHGPIQAYPGARKLDRWQKPRGQTIGFTPYLDVYEQVDSRSWKNREEILAFSAGAEVCIRRTERISGSAQVRWATYRPASAKEGLDDVTSLHLLRPGNDFGDAAPVNRLTFIVGTANGNLNLVSIPSRDDQDLTRTSYQTSSLPVRSTTIAQTDQGRYPLLAANLGESLFAIYKIQSSDARVEPICQLDLAPKLNQRANQAQPGQASRERAWTTAFLNPHTLAIGTGLSYEPLQIYRLREDGICLDPLRSMSIVVSDEKLDAAGRNAIKKPLSAVYSIVPLPGCKGDQSVDPNLFLSGAYDGVVRLHDMRSDHPFVRSFADTIDDSAIYSILPRGQDRFLAGTSRHNLLKVFDLRSESGCFELANASSSSCLPDAESRSGFSVFLRQHEPAMETRAGRGRARPARIADSSVYNLRAASMYSPYIYAGLENQVMSLALHSTADPFPDNAFFSLDETSASRRDVINLSMYEHDEKVYLNVQRGINDPAGQVQWRTGRDWRWMGAAEAHEGRWQRGQVV